MNTDSQARLAILTNILAPYRIPVYQRLGERFRTLVLLSGEEDNRHWDSKADDLSFEVRRVRGITLKWHDKQSSGRTSDIRYAHVNLQYLWELWRFRPDAIISTEMGFRTLLALLYSLVARRPLWVWWGGTLHTERSRSRAKRLLRRLVFAHAVRRWISYGETSTEYLQSLTIPRERIIQIQNCVDERLYNIEVVSRPLSEPHPRALFVGQLIGRKGIDEILAVTSQLQQSGLVFSLIIIGDGPEASHVSREVERLRISHLLHIRQIPYEDMPTLYRAADFLVFPTLEDVWGLVVNESLLCGRPVIASKYAGSACELLPPENIFDPQNCESFSDAFTRAIDGKLAPPDKTRLLTIDQVANIIVTDIVQRIGPSLP